MVVVVTVVVVAGLPSLVGAWPVAQGAGTTAVALLARVRTAAPVSYQGYAESQGGLALPQFSQLGNLPSLFTGTTQMRVWWGGPTRWRVDVPGQVGEQDTYGDVSGSWTWDSLRNRATMVTGHPPLYLPRPVDLLPSLLGRRLADATSVSATRLPPRRVAGLDALGLRLTPSNPGTTVAHVDLWVDPSNGIPLEVQVSAVGNPRPVLKTTFLDLSWQRPASEVTTFVPPAGASVQAVTTTGLEGVLRRFAPYPLPASLAGLPRQQVPGAPAQGIATYGGGFTTLVAVSLTRGDADAFGQLFRAGATSLLAPGSATGPVAVPGAHAAFLSAGLFQGLLVRTCHWSHHQAWHRYYLLAGTATQAVLARAAAQLVAGPSPGPARPPQLGAPPAGSGPGG